MKGKKFKFPASIPPPPTMEQYPKKELVQFKNVSVSYGKRQILDGIDWTIKKGDFWQLIGPNGSGKTTLFTMITGNNHKGYGQDLTLFGHKKGSGESIWDLKEHIGYFTLGMLDRFGGYHTVLDMVISGLHESVGLYTRPSEIEIRTATQWLRLLGLENKKDRPLRELGTAGKRLAIIARAMIKHPPLLILDEPTAGLDDYSAAFCITGK